MVLQIVRDNVLPKIQSQEPILSWIVNDTGIPKKGKRSVGVTRQYREQLGKQDMRSVNLPIHHLCQPAGGLEALYAARMDRGSKPDGHVGEFRRGCITNRIQGNARRFGLW